MSDEQTSRIILLTEGNYEVWCIQMISVLIAADLWDVIRPLEEITELPKGQKGVQMQQKKHELACAKITLALDPSQLPFVMGIEDPHKMWEAIEEVHCSFSLNHALSLCRAFFCIFKDEKETVIGWVTRVCGCAIELSHTPCPATIIDIILVITKGLPPKYTPIITQLENLPVASLTISAVTQCLIGFESQSSHSHTTASSSMDLMANVAWTDVICHQCNGHGHFKCECPTPKGLSKLKKIKVQGAHEDEDEESEGHIVACYAHMDRSESLLDVVRLY